jgi:protein required for attachment to host cells
MQSEDAMKPISTLYMLLNEEDYRLIHTHGEGLAEISHAPAELTAAGVVHVTGHSPKEAIERNDLAKHASHVLATEWAKGSYDRIVISAGPKMLGAFRDALPKALHSHIATELHKDLVKVPLHDLLTHFPVLSAI